MLPPARTIHIGLLLCLLWGLCPQLSQLSADETRLTQYLADPTSLMMAYTPSRLDPRDPANHDRLKTVDIAQDLQVLRPQFDGLILYGYHEADTPRIVDQAQQQGFRAVLLGIWNPRSAAELDGVIALARQYQDTLAIGILVGNEGLHFGRYEVSDVEFAARRIRAALGSHILLATSEPYARYEDKFVLEFGDFLAPNIHPVFDRPELTAIPASEWVHAQAIQLHQKTGKLVIVKETGFPHAGKPQFTPQAQQEFWQAYLRQPGTPGVFHRVAFEAFDLPWKSEASGLEIEKSWGWFDTNRKPLPVFEARSKRQGERQK